MGNLKSRKEKLISDVLELYGPTLKAEDLPQKLTSNTILTPNCVKCEVKYPITSNKTRTRLKQAPYVAFMCPDCSKEEARAVAKQTIQRRYNGHYMQLEAYKTKVANTNNLKYGGNSPMHSEAIKSKVNNTMLKKYGSTRATGVESSQAKRRSNSLAKYGTDHPVQSVEVKNKIKRTNLEKYGVDNPAKLKAVQQKALCSKGLRLKEDALPEIIQDLKANPKQIITSKEFQQKHGVYYVTIFRWLRESGNAHLIPKGHQSSTPEKELYEFIKSEYKGVVQQNVTGLLNTKMEVDIYLPELNLAIEFNHLYWHSELKKPKNYHFLKRELLNAVNIELIQINEDEWSQKTEIVKSILRTKLGLITNKIPARKTRLKEVPKTEALEFLKANHLMGPSQATSNFGLYYEDELVCLATFKRMVKGYELNRFCSKLNVSVQGGLSKLIKNLNPSELISFVDLRYANGNSLIRLGFNKIGITLGWKWTDFISTFNRSYCRANMDNRKLTQKEHANELKLTRIFDAGQAKFVYKASEHE